MACTWPSAERTLMKNIVKPNIRRIFAEPSRHSERAGPAAAATRRPASRRADLQRGFREESRASNFPLSSLREGLVMAPTRLPNIYIARMMRSTAGFQGFETAECSARLRSASPLRTAPSSSAWDLDGSSQRASCQQFSQRIGQSSRPEVSSAHGVLVRGVASCFRARDNRNGRQLPA